MTWWKAALAAAMAWTCVTAAQAQQAGRWLRTETPQFVVYSDGSEREARDAIADLESFDALLRLITGVRSDRPQPRLDVYLFTSATMLSRVEPDTRRRTFGFYQADLEAVSIFATLRSSTMSERHSLYHEYAHHFAFQHFPAAYPAWYTEGFAEFVATADITPSRTRYGLPSDNRSAWLVDGDWISLERLLTVEPSTLNTDDVAMFYAQSWLFVHYILSNREAGTAFQAYSRALHRGAEPIAAFSEAFQTTPADMQGRLRGHFRRLPYTNLTGWDGATHAALTFTRLPASSDDILPLYARLRAGLVRTDSDAGVLVEQLRAAAARAPDDALVQTTLARAELRVGDYARARAALTPMVTANPNAHEPNYLMGLSYLDEERLNPEADSAALNITARRYLTRAAGIDRRHAPTLYRYAQAAWSDPAQAENAFDVLLEARSLSPQVPEIAVVAAVNLMQRDRHADAAALLRPIAFNPHVAAESLAPIRELLAQAEAGEGGGPAMPEVLR